MLRSLRRSIGVRAARFHFRSSREKVISFGHSISTSDRVLVVMPLDHPDEEGQTHVLTFLREHFYEPDITVVAPAGGTPVERVLPRCRVVLVVMPLRFAQEDGQTHVLTFLREHFYEPDITVIAPSGGTPVVRVLPRCRVLHLGRRDVNAFFLPRRAFLAGLAERSYDLAIDLNLDFMIPSAYICKETNARVRTGFSALHADTFFNFQIRLEPGSQRPHAYDRLVRCLQMFFSAEGV